MLTQGGPGRVVRELSNARAREQIIELDKFIPSESDGGSVIFPVMPTVMAVAVGAPLPRRVGVIFVMLGWSAGHRVVRRYQGGNEVRVIIDIHGCGCEWEIRSYSKSKSVSVVLIQGSVES